MNPNFEAIIELAPLIALVVTVGVAGWVVTTWLKIKNGYPLETSWGTPLHPTTDREAAERIKLLSTENAQLRAEIGAMKDRLETIERIVTDEPSRLEREINSLAKEKGGHA
ncbi:MAG: hypothetical protein ACR2JJ_03430 [Sphingomicrobium sp.]